MFVAIIVMHITDKLNLCHVHVVCGFSVGFSLVISLSVIIKSHSMKYYGFNFLCHELLVYAQVFNTILNVRISEKKKATPGEKKLCASVVLIFQCGRNNKILYVKMSDL